jgi:hypothetical protein
MDRWEYKAINLTKLYPVNERTYPAKLLSDFMTELQEAGTEGWEAVGQTTISSNQDVVQILLFKRKIA